MFYLDQRLMQQAMMTGTQFNVQEEGKSRARKILENLKMPESVQYSMQFDPKDILVPQPIMRLEHVLGFTGRTCPDIRMNPSQAHSNDLIYAVGKLMVAYNTQTQH